jgi:hypothetical protein
VTEAMKTISLTKMEVAYLLMLLKAQDHYLAQSIIDLLQATKV